LEWIISPANTGFGIDTVDLEQQLAGFLSLIEACQHDPTGYLDASKCYCQLDQSAEAIRILELGIQFCPSAHVLYRSYINLLERLNRPEEATLVAIRGRAVLPADLYLKLKEHLLLPIVYESEEELIQYRNRYATGLEILTKDLKLDALHQRRNAFDSIEGHDTFLLSYQGQNDRDIQVMYSDLVTRIVTANAPPWYRPKQASEHGTANAPLRIGFVSSSVCYHSVTKLYLSWIRELDRAKFRSFVYHLGSRTDAWTRVVSLACNGEFRHVPLFETAAQSITADNLDVLVFLDIGMLPRVRKLAALRLAPVQCATWGHPVTTGMAEIDYFLSSEQMEPPNSVGHYSEQLVTFPGVGLYFSHAPIVKATFTKQRHEFGIRDDAVVYLCCQSSSKYLPQYDELFGKIARQVHDALFVFVATNRAAGEALRTRVRKALAGEAADPDTHYLVLNELGQHDYWNLNVLSDVFLDTPGWSGGVTSFEALICGLPIVTMPGDSMRSRHTAGILRTIGLLDTIVSSPEEYVNVAIHLGRDAEFRNKQKYLIEEQIHGLYTDRRWIDQMDDFLTRVARDASR